MKKMKLLSVAFLYLAVLAVAQNPAEVLPSQDEKNADKTVQEKRPSDWTFSNAFVSIEAGELYPFGDLIDAVENSAYVGIGFRYAYWENVDGFVKFDYSYFEPIPESVPYDGVHQFSGKLGLDFKWPLINPLVFGFGFTCNWTRADLDDGDDKNAMYSSPGGTLTDNETEFGWFARLNLPVWNTENFRVGLNVAWEELWTLPKRSDMLAVGLYVERRIW